MPFRVYAPMVMTAQGGAVRANTQMGMQVVQTILPPPPVMAELDDVVMSESGEVSIQSERSQPFTTQKYQESSVIQEDVALNTMRQTQEALARIQSELAQKRQADEAILAAHAEAAIQAERLRAAKEAEDRLKAHHFQTEADFAERLRIQHAVSQIKTGSGSANFQQCAKSHDAANVAVKREKSTDKEATAARADALLAAQLQATIHTAKQRTKSTTTASTAVKTEAGARTTKAPAPKSSDGAKAKTKKATSKTGASRKVRRGRYPSDSDPSSEDDDSDSSSDDSDSSFYEPLSDMVAPKATHGGTTTMIIRPFVTASSLDDFDEKASLSERTRWWERFQTLAFQGGWSDKMKVYELRLKLSSSARNWRSQLSPHVRRDWTRFSKEFKVKYCKSKMSDSEKYYTMKQRKAETPLDFLYRLNAAADRADIRYKKSERRREQHVKRFIHRLEDSQLKSILKSQRFKSMDDLEYVLKQQEDDWDDDRQGSSSTKARDFRADNLRQGRLRTKYPGRAYVTQSGDESDSDERHVAFEDETLERPKKTSSLARHFLKNKAWV
ncbi:hypothetical protein PHMEG_00028531, partial [Phytophthora megakarya]